MEEANASLKSTVLSATLAVLTFFPRYSLTFSSVLCKSFPTLAPEHVCVCVCVLQVLDEVERRRALSPALVQPFMRAIMEAQFPAPGRTISIKTFLPGSGTEVTGPNENLGFEKQEFTSKSERTWT